MTTISARFDDAELNEINAMRGDRSWHDFILQLLRRGAVVQSNTGITKKDVQEMIRSFVTEAEVRDIIKHAIEELKRGRF